MDAPPRAPLLLRRALYPAMVFGPPILALLLFRARGSLALASLGGTLFMILFTTALERAMPFRRDWRFAETPRDLADSKLNFLYWISSFSMQEGLKAVGYALGAPAMAWVLARTGVRPLRFDTWNVLLQVLLLFVISDFFVYWFHRAMHEIPAGWAIHQVHHSLPQLNFTAAARLHPLEHFVNSGPRYATMIALSPSPEALLLFLSVFASFGFTHHCNVDVETDWLDRVIYTPVYHRFHHSRVIRESNTNYAGPLLLWDFVFRTLYRPHARGPEILGLAPDDAFPRAGGRGAFATYWEQLRAPFRR